MPKQQRLSLACGVLPAALALTLLFAGEAGAQVARTSSDPLSALVFRSDRLTPSQPIAPLEDYQSAVPGAVQNGWAAFRLGSDVEWRASIDRRTGMISFGEGGGIGWIPGRGNSLTAADIAPYTGGKAPDLAVLEKIARAFLPRVSGLLGVDPAALVLNRARSGSPASHVWFVDFDVVVDGLPIESARVVFRVNSGNLVQFGSETLPAPGGGPAAPPAPPGPRQALARPPEDLAGFSGPRPSPGARPPPPGPVPP